LAQLSISSNSNILTKKSNSILLLDDMIFQTLGVGLGDKNEQNNRNLALLLWNVQPLSQYRDIVVSLWRSVSHNVGAQQLNPSYLLELCTDAED